MKPTRRFFSPTVPVKIVYGVLILPREVLIEGMPIIQTKLRRFVLKDGHRHLITEDYPDYRETNPRK